MGFNFPIWFLPSLFCTEMLWYVLKRYFKSKVWIPVMVLLGLGVLLAESHSMRLPFGLDISLLTLFFVWIGQCLKQDDRMERYVCRLRLSRKLLWGGVFLALSIGLSVLNSGEQSVSMVHRTFHNYALYGLTALSGSMFVFYLSSALPQLRFFDFYGRNTLFILGLHLPVFGLIKGVQVFLLHLPLSAIAGQLWVSLLYVALTFGILAPVIYWVNRYAPFLIGRKKGIW
jgi:fucose 4-O-acetylase-like acetyltransferase